MGWSPKQPLMRIAIQVELSTLCLGYVSYISNMHISVQDLPLMPIR